MVKHSDWMLERNVQTRSVVVRVCVSTFQGSVRFEYWSRVSKLKTQTMSELTSSTLWTRSSSIRLSRNGILSTSPFLFQVESFTSSPVSLPFERVVVLSFPTNTHTTRVSLFRIPNNFHCQSERMTGRHQSLCFSSVTVLLLRIYS